MLARIVVTSMVLGQALLAERLIDVKGYLLVTTRVNGHGPFVFLLDTGASSTSVTPAVARAAGLVPRSRVRLATAAGEALVPQVPEVEITVGTSTAISEALIQPLDPVRSIDARIDGVLGQSFLSRFPCFIDYRNHRLLLGEEAARMGETLANTVAAQRVDGRLVVPVAVEKNAKLLRLVLDSGAPALVVACSVECPRLISTFETTLRTNAGTRTVHRGTVSSATIGDIRILRPPAVIMKTPPLSTQEDGLLPTRLFSAVYLGPGNVVRLAR